MDDWKKLKKEYISGGISHRELSKKYGVSYSTLKKVAAREHWTELRNRVGAKESAKVVDAVSSRNARLDDAVDLAIEAVCDILQRGKGSMRAVDVRDCVTALKSLREMRGIKNEADAEEQRARIEALRARAAMNKPVDDEGEEYGVMVLPDAQILPTSAEDNREGEKYS